MQKRNVLNSSRLIELKKHRRKIAINKILILLIAILAILILLAYLSRLNTLNISNIEVSGNQVVDTKDIQTVAMEQMAGKYLWVFPKTNVFLYPKNVITQELQNKYKRLENINLSIENDRTLHISLVERKALYTWCGTTAPTIEDADNQKCYFIDENGYIFDEAPNFSGDVYFRFYGIPDSEPSNSGDDLNPSGFYFSKLYFKQLVYFKNLLIGFSLKPTSLYVESDGDAHFLLSRSNLSLSSPQITFKISDDYQSVAENLEAALTTDPLKSEFENKYSSLQYIDLRFGNKIYYKFSPSTSIK